MTATAQHPAGARDDHAPMFRFLPLPDSHDLTDRIEHDPAAVLTGCTTSIHLQLDGNPPQTPDRAVAPGGKRPR